MNIHESYLNIKLLREKRHCLCVLDMILRGYKTRLQGIITADHIIHEIMRREG